MTRAGVGRGRGHHRAGGYHIQVGVEERDAVGGGEEVLTRVVERRGLAGHLDSQGQSEGLVPGQTPLGPDVNTGRPSTAAAAAALRAQTAPVGVAGQGLLQLPALDEFAGGRGEGAESEALPGHVVEGVVGLFEAALQGLRHQDAGGHQGLGLLLEAGRGGGGRHDPGVAPQLLHGETFPGVNSEETLGEALGLAGDTAPGLPLQSEVSLLDPPHHVAGAVRLQAGEEGRPPAEHGVLKQERSENIVPTSDQYHQY